MAQPIRPSFPKPQGGYAYVLTSAVACAALADFLFYGHVVGWTAGLFAFCLWALLVARRRRALSNPAGWATAAATAGLVAALVVEPAPLPVAMTATALVLLALLGAGPLPPNAAAWAARAAAVVPQGLVRMVVDARVVLRRLRRRPTSLRGPARLVIAWVGPLALGAVFAGLFAIANPLIEQALSRAADAANRALAHLDALIDLPRNLFWLITAAAVYVLLRVRRRPPAPPPAGPSADTAYVIEPISHARVVARCLLVCNAVFAVQNGLDLIYLFGGAALPPGMTYAHYAHRGAYPLVATALLAALFVLMSFRPGGAAERSFAARRLVYLWVAQTVFLTATAARRLDLYVEAFSLTRLRLAAAAWMLLVGAGLVWIGCRIVLRRGNTWLLNANALTAAALLYAACFVNFDRVVADFNAAHCREAGAGGGPIDLDYLRDLGPDALPALEAIAPALPPARRAVALRHTESLQAELREQLDDWRGWTLRRASLNVASAAPHAAAERSAGRAQRRRG